MAVVRSCLFVCAALVGCTGSQPAPEKDAPAPVKAVETPAPPVPVKPEAPAPAVDGGEDEAATMPYPPGIVPPYDELGGVIVRPQELAGSEPLEGPLSKVDECAADPSACEYPPGVLGFHPDGRVAVIEAPTIGGCARDMEPLDAWGRVGRADALAAAKKVMFKPGKHDERGTGKAHAFVQAQAKAGFKPPDDLVFLQGAEVIGIDGVMSLALLREPLAGWLMHTKLEGAATIRLVDPTNKKAHVLAELPSEGASASLVQVVLDPGRAHVWVTVALNYGEHCEQQRVATYRWKIPAGAAKEAK